MISSLARLCGERIGAKGKTQNPSPPTPRRASVSLACRSGKRDACPTRGGSSPQTCCGCSPAGVGSGAGFLPPKSIRPRKASPAETTPLLRSDKGQGSDQVDWPEQRQLVQVQRTDPADDGPAHQQRPPGPRPGKQREAELPGQQQVLPQAEEEEPARGRNRLGPVCPA